MSEPRCPECGSWERECISPVPIADCGCNRCMRSRLAEAEAYGKAQQRWAHEWRDKHDALTAENAALRAAAGKVQCFHCGNLISEAWTRLGPCPSCADLRKLLGEKP
jgi:hypothetical protein